MQGELTSLPTCYFIAQSWSQKNIIYKPNTTVNTGIDLEQALSYARWAHQLTIMLLNNSILKVKKIIFCKRNTTDSTSNGLDKAHSYARWAHQLTNKLLHRLRLIPKKLFLQAKC